MVDEQLKNLLLESVRANLNFMKKSISYSELENLIATSILAARTNIIKIVETKGNAE
jgi:hypothetical protein